MLQINLSYGCIWCIVMHYYTINELYRPADFFSSSFEKLCK